VFFIGSIACSSTSRAHACGHEAPEALVHHGHDHEAALPPFSSTEDTQDDEQVGDIQLSPTQHVRAYCLWLKRVIA
jgi:hypothetical protein